MKPKNILVITHWGYEEGLIQSYTLPYLKIIHTIIPGAKIYLCTQEKKDLQKDKAKLKKIKDELEQENIFLLPEKYYRAGITKYLISFFRLFKHIGLIFKKKIGFIHSFCTPAGAYAYWLSKFTGRKLVIDSYEPHSEYMKDAGTWPENGFAYRFLKQMEKKQAVKADFLIATTPTMQAYTEQRFNIHLKNVFVKPACVDLEKFSFKDKEACNIRKQLNLQNKVVGVYAGKFGDFYLKEEAFQLFRSAFEILNDDLHILLLSDLAKDQLVSFCKQYDLNVDNFSLVLAPHDEMPSYLSAADFAFSLYRQAPSKKFCTPIKNGEYWAVGLPVIITNDISIDSEIIERNNIGYVLKELSGTEYKKAIENIRSLLNGDRQMLREKIRAIATGNRSFSIAEKIYGQIYS